MHEAKKPSCVKKKPLHKNVMAALSKNAAKRDAGGKKGLLSCCK